MKIHQCPEHPVRWSTRCDGCRKARTDTLTTLQSCTVHGPGQCVCVLMDLVASVRPAPPRRGRSAA